MGQAQSGITNAIGFAIESLWRQAPLTVISGARNKIGVANQNPLRYFVVQPGAGFVGKPEIMVPDNEIDGDVQLTRTKLTGMDYGGRISFQGDGENLYYPLLQMFGKDVQTTTQAAGGGASAVYQHVFTPNKYAPSVIAEEQLGAGDYGRVSGGICLPSMGLNFGADLVASLGMTPYRQVPNTYRNPAAANAKTNYQFGTATTNKVPAQFGGDNTKCWEIATPTYVDVEQEQPQELGGTGPFVFGEMVYGLAGGQFAAAYMTIDGVAVDVTPLEGFTLDITRKIDASMVAGSGLDKGVVTGSQIGFTGRIPLLFNDLTVTRAMLRHSPIGFNFSIIGVVIGASPGTAAYLIDVYLPDIRLLVPDGPDATDGPMQVGGTYVARRSPSLGYACQITVRNTFDASQLGGMYPLNALLHAANPVVALDTTATLSAATAKNIVPGDTHIYLDSATGFTEQIVVSSFNYGTGVVTYLTAFVNPYAVATTTIKRTTPGGLGGWSNA